MNTTYKIFFMLLTIFIAGCDATTVAEKQQPKQSAPGAATAQEKNQAKNAAASSSFDDANSDENKKSQSVQDHMQAATKDLMTENFAGTKEEREKLLENANSELNSALKKRPGMIAALNDRAVVYVKAGKLTEAEAEFKQILVMDPKNGDALYNLACVYAKMKKLDLSADYLDAALINGFRDRNALRTDPDLAALRKTAKFQQIMDKNKVYFLGIN